MSHAQSLDDALIQRVIASHPLPIADALTALSAANSLHERRDRVVEAFRAVVRYAAAVTLAARVQHGPGPAAEKEQLLALLRGLRNRGLTDGQWVALMRGLLGTWSSKPSAHPVPELAPLFCGRAKKHLAAALDGLLEMRKSETVAHGATGSTDAIAQLLERREPQLADLLQRFEPVWQHSRLVVPLSPPENDAEPQHAFDLHGTTPPQGRFRRCSLAAGHRLPPAEPILIDPSGKPLVSFHPVALFQRPSPDATEELFLLDGANKRAAVFVAFPSMAQFREAAVWSHLGASLFGEADEDAAPPSTGGVSQPYRGLSSFGPEHSALFFGRERQAQSLANRIRRHPMITLTGASGSGKSSLLYAGVFPLLEDFIVIQLRPGADPITGLVRQLTQTFEELDGSKVHARLDAAPESLGSILEPLAIKSGSKIVLFVDQGEELFTLCHDEARREAFAAAIASAGDDADAPSRVVLSLREDYFARVANLGALRGRYARQVEVVATPDRDELTRILIAPAQLFGFMFEDLALVEEMIERVHGEAAALAMLQFCADQLWLRRDRSWKRLTWDAYRSIGGVEGALAAHAEATIEEMTASQQALARRMLLRLVTEEGTRAVVAKHELLSFQGEPEGAAAVLDRLLQARLLTTRELFDDEQATVVVEVVHEALLAHWDRLREWLDQDAVFVRTRARLAKAANRWEQEARTNDLLLGDGKPLLEARELLEARRELLREVEVAFIDASEKRSRGLLRLKRGAIGALVLLALVAAGFGVFAWQARGRAEEAARQAAASEKVAVDRSVTLLTEQGRRELIDDRPLRALVYLQDAFERGGNSVALKSLLSSASRPADAMQATLRQAGPSVYYVGYRADGKQLAVADSDGGLELFDPLTQVSLRRLSLAKRRVDRVSYTPDGQFMIVERGEVRFIDDTGKLLKRIAAHRRSIMDATLSADGKLLATGSVDGAARLWQRDGKLLFELQGHEKSVMALAFSADGERLATGSRDKKVRVFDTQTGELVVTLTGHQHGIERVSFDPQTADRLLSASSGEANLWDVASGQQLKQLDRSRGSATVARYGPNSAILVAGYDNRGQIWDADGKPLASFAGHDDFARGGAFTPGAVNDVRWSHDSEVLYSRGSDATVRVWDASTGRRLETLMAHIDRLGAIAVNPLTGQLASGGFDGAVYLWHSSKGAMIDSLGQSAGGQPPTDPVLSVAENGDASRLLLRHRSGKLTLSLRDGHSQPLDVQANAEPLAPGFAAIAQAGQLAVALAKPGHLWHGDADGKALVQFQAHDSALFAIAISRDGTTLATSAEDGVKLWQRDKLIRTLRGSQSGVHFLTFSDDGTHLAGAERGPVHVWDVSSGELVVTVPADPNAAARYPRARFSRDGSRIASLTSPLTINVWTLSPPAAELHLDGGLIDFSPDGTRVVVAASSPVVRVVDAHSGEIVASLDGHTKRISALGFLPDGQRVVTASEDGSARLWEAASGKTLEIVRAHHSIDDALIPQSAARLITFGDGVVKRWKLPLETRDTIALGALVDRSCPWKLENGGLVEKRAAPTQP